MRLKLVIVILTLYYTLAVASNKGVREYRQTGRYGPSYGGGNSGPNYGPGTGNNRPIGQSIISGLGSSGGRPSLQVPGYSFGGTNGRLAGRPNIQSNGPRPGSLYRVPPGASGIKPVINYKG